METIRNSYRGSQVAPLAIDSAFVAQVHACVAAGFGRSDFESDDTRFHLRADYVDIARDTEGNVVGFLSARFGKGAEMLPGVDLGEVAETDVAYLFGTAIRPEVQGNGLYKSLAEAFIRESLDRGFSTILFSTQNPHVEAGFDKAVARVMEEGAIGNVGKTRIPIPGRYGRLLTGDYPPEIRDRAIQGAYGNLRRDVGDAFAVVYTLGSMAGGGRRSPF